MEIKINGHYVLKKRLGAGSFGEIFLAEDTQTKQEVAAKLEQVKTRSPQLFYESKLYLVFASGVSIPRLHWYGTESNYNIMVIDLLGKNLEDLFGDSGRKFSLKTVLMIADQTISAIEYIHSKSFIHRDIKPDNFLIGMGNQSSHIYMIDFGLSKKFRDPKTHEHYQFSQGKSLTGTARYASINALKGHEQSRRDDLEALGYMYIYFLLGTLPWQGLAVEENKTKYERILEVKSATNLEDLCKTIPSEFLIYLNSVKSLAFDEEPQYHVYRELFRSLFINSGFVYDYQYDWVPQAVPIIKIPPPETINQKTAETPRQNIVSFPKVKPKQSLQHSASAKKSDDKKPISKSSPDLTKTPVTKPSWMSSSSFKRSQFK